MPSGYYKTNAIVLKARDLSEKDRIITFLSPTLGRFDAVGKGIKKMTGKSIGKLEPMNEVSMMVSPGRSLDTIRQSELINAFRNIRNSLELTAAGLYMLDLINRRVEKNESNPPLYKLLRTCLRLLNESADYKLVNRYFELKLISILGYMPQIYRCIGCNERGDYKFLDFHMGGLLCPKCISEAIEGHGCVFSVGTLKTMRFMGKCTPDKLKRLRVDNRIAGEVKNALSGFIEYNLPGSNIDKEGYNRLIE